MLYTKGCCVRPIRLVRDTDLIVDCRRRTKRGFIKHEEEQKLTSLNAVLVSQTKCPIKTLQFIITHTTLKKMPSQ